MAVTISILADNAVERGRFTGEHGFSAHIAVDGEKILFDTGQGMVFRRNAALLGVDLDSVQKVILSHGHYDHGDGIPSLTFAKVQKPHIYLHPSVFSRRFAKDDTGGYREIGISWSRQSLTVRGAALVESAVPQFIYDGVAVSGTIPRTTDFENPGGPFYMMENNAYIADEILDDQALYIKTPAGLIVLTGCAHSGIINTVLYGQRLMQEERIAAVIGGTHLIHAPADRLRKTVQCLRELCVGKVCAGHCTGFDGTCFLMQELGERFERITAGWERSF
jgi:7,8-dihydropterin-6-yl-methyl-4-(beta-D-ribofuranosyl)aminobenzene 5'-phosphate synthase